MYQIWFKRKKNVTLYLNFKVVLHNHKGTVKILEGIN